VLLWTADGARGFMDLSIVIPVKDEAANVAPLIFEIRSALNGLIAYEVIFVDDGSEDATSAEIARLQTDVPQLRLLRHRHNCGQSAAIRTGVRAARAAWIATLDGDGQNDPADILTLWQIGHTASEAKPVLLTGYRADRQDSWAKRVASRFANHVRRRLLSDDTPDTGCGLKLFPRSLFLDLPYFDHMHRFLPALVLREGGMVQSVPVNHRPRRQGMSKYGIFDRLAVGAVDLFGVIWLKRRAACPQIPDEVSPNAACTPSPPSFSNAR
jgi:dolichol-phosphate mannosyltransferase